MLFSFYWQEMMNKFVLCGYSVFVLHVTLAHKNCPLLLCKISHVVGSAVYNAIAYWPL
jgi:hypothetical protein